MLRSPSLRAASILSVATLTALACSSSKKPPPAAEITDAGPLHYATGGDASAVTASGGAGAGGQSTGAGGASTSSGGAGGTTDAGFGAGGLLGTSGTGGVPDWMKYLDAGPVVADPYANCPVTVTFACRGFCTALSQEPTCAPYFQDLQTSIPPPDNGYSDGGLEGQVALCGCACEATLRTAYCHSKFDDFVSCGSTPLSAVCSTVPGSEKDFPQIVGPCGALRSTYTDCTAMFP